MSSKSSSSHASHSLLVLALGALGVVYGDIGTSPLYAVREIFFNHHYHIEHSHQNILGVISTIIWTLTVIVTFKYVVLVLRADNKGEGGVFALYSLLQKNKKWLTLMVSGLLVFAAGLLFGDGIITPAISVVSAIEGLTVVTPAFSPYVVPITLAILTALFAVQRWGTAKIGSVFGPIIALWFAALTIIGLKQLVGHPEVLLAFNPWYAWHFLTTTPIHVLMSVLGSVMLVVTGGEAMYADMGHFGRNPIRMSWFGLTYPALVINYLGQGAYLLSEAPVIGGNLFFSMVPQMFLIPMVVLATMATIIASQALITGAFSLAMQAISLRLLPYMKAVHTHEHHEGQIYVPMINWALYVGCVLLVLAFKSSSNLASAYGLAVSGVMLITTMSMILIALYRWKWSPLLAYGLFVPLALVDSMFLVANSLKILAGGYVPLLVAVVFYGIMKSWLWGRNKVQEAISKQSLLTIAEVIDQKRGALHHLPNPVVFLAEHPRLKDTDTVPMSFQAFWRRNKVMPEHMIFLTVKSLKTPHVAEDKRYTITNFFHDAKRGSITSVVINHGFMEEPNVDAEFAGIAAHEHIPVSGNHADWVVHVIREHVVIKSKLSIREFVKYKLFQLLSHNSVTQDQYWGVGVASQLSLSVVPVELG